MGFGRHLFNPRASRKSADRRHAVRQPDATVRIPDAIVRQPATPAPRRASAERQETYGAGSSAIAIRSVPVVPTVIRRRTVVGSVHTGRSPSSPRTSGGDHTTSS